jgi:dUTP pyrophosphatase
VENTFVCQDCSRSFGTVQALTAHRRVHKDEPHDDNAAVLNALRTFSPEQEQEAVYQEVVEKAEQLRPVVKVKKLPHGKDLPELMRATPGSAAVDLYAAIDKQMWLGPSEQAKPPVPTGIAVEIPVGYVGKIAPRSGLAAKNGISIVNSPGIIDSDYRGEIMITLINHSRHRFAINPGDRIAQMLIEKVEPVVFQYVEELSQTERGEGGFGSTGTAMTLTPGRTINFLDASEKPDGLHVRKLPPNHDLRKNEV